MAKGFLPLPNIDQLVVGTSGYRCLNFMDAYSGYNQIQMHLNDEEKIDFITEDENICYRVMSFRLKNIGATYQRLMSKVFADQISQKIEVYVDDMVAKVSENGDHYRSGSSSDPCPLVEE